MSLGQDGPATRTRMPEGHGGGGGRRPPQPRRALVTVVGIVVLLVAAIAFANRGDGSGSSGSGGTQAGGSGGGKGSTSTTATAPTGERPVSGKSGGIPSGFAHTEQGAESAAANYAVALGGVDMFNTDRRHAIISTIADTGARNALQTGFDHDYSSAFATQVGLTPEGQAPQGQTFVSRTLPAGSKTSHYDNGSADVSVWCTGLFGLAGQGSTKPVTSNWFTLTFKLHWSGSDWKVVQAAQSQGPTPVSGDNPVSTADQISGAVQGFGGFTYAR